MLDGQANLLPALVLTVGVIAILYFTFGGQASLFPRDTRKTGAPATPMYCKHCGRTDKKWRLRTTGGGNTAATQGPRHTVWVHICQEGNRQACPHKL